MKYSNMLLSSLLVSTALTTGASAANVYLTGDYATTYPSGTALAVRTISAQAFPAVPSTTTAIGTNRLFIRFAQNVANATFTGSVNVTGAKFVTSGVSGSAYAATFAGASIGSIADLTAACTVVPGASTLILTCNTASVNAPAGSITTSSINGLVISGIAFDNVSALSTAGTSVSLDFQMKINNDVFDTAAATAVVTSRNSLTGSSTVAATAPAKIDVANATGSFLKLVGPVTSAVIGSLSFTIGSASYARDLSTALTASGSTTGSAEVKVTSSIFSDDATSKITIDTIQSVTSTQFGAGFVTFAMTAAQLVSAASYTITVDFNGTKEIDTAGAGTTLITFASPAGGGTQSNVSAPPAISGAVSGLSRNGLSIDLNGLQPGTAQGARQYTSLVRVANTGTTAGTVTMIVSNENTGTVLGTYTSSSIPVGASLQVSSAQIEVGAGITPSASVGYRVAISGNITGYAQHVTWNQDAGFFGDLSARRDVVTSVNN